MKLAEVISQHLVLAADSTSTCSVAGALATMLLSRCCPSESLS